MKLRECGDGLYYFDTPSHDNTTNNSVSNYYFISTIADKNIIYASGN